MKFSKYLFAGLILCLSDTAASGIVLPPRTLTVGADLSCDFSAIQEAIDDANSGDTIRIADNQVYADQSLQIDSKSIELVGGFDDCDDDSRVFTTHIFGDTTQSVLTITSGSDDYVRLHALTFRDGGGVDGGGLRISGDVQVELSYVALYDNHSSQGGGLSIRNGATLHTQSPVNIGIGESMRNTASSGGGIYCQNATVDIGGTKVLANIATDNGGGVYIESCQLLVPDESTVWQLNHNQANRGGGLFVTGSSHLFLNTVAGNAPARIAWNQSFQGGGIYVTGNGVDVNFNGVHVYANEAILGGAALVENGASLDFDRGPIDGSECSEQNLCSAIFDNVAEDSGAVVYARSGGKADIQATFLYDNEAQFGSLFHITDANSELYLANSSLANNTALDGYTFAAINAASIDIRHITTEQSHGSYGVLSVAGGAHLGVRNSILWEDSTILVQALPSTTNFLCNNATPGNNIGADSHIPGFVQLASDNGMGQQLSSGSHNVDRCASAPVLPFDVLGKPRHVNLDGVPDAYDRGAFEWQDLIFSDSMGDG